MGAKEGFDWLASFHADRQRGRIEWEPEKSLKCGREKFERPVLIGGPRVHTDRQYHDVVSCHQSFLIPVKCQVGDINLYGFLHFF